MTDFSHDAHQFSFKLPFYPKYPEEGEELELKMDGRDLKGVTGLHLRAGNNGFTNVVIEMEAKCAAEFAGHLIAHADHNLSDDTRIDLAEGYSIVRREVEADMEGMGIESDYLAQSELVLKIVEMVIQTLK